MAARIKMSREERAKQFMPFAALRGYEEALKQREKIVVSKIELSEEMKGELDLKFSQVHGNDIITVIYFSNGEYLKLTGMVSRLDKDARILKIVNTKIPFEDIYNIEIEEQ